jgi:hypothetical protein
MSCLIKISKGSKAMKVHTANGDNRPVCGGGRGGLAVRAWQQDIGPANCKRCKQVLEQREAKAKQKELVL